TLCLVGGPIIHLVSLPDFHRRLNFAPSCFPTRKFAAEIPVRTQHQATDSSRSGKSLFHDTIILRISVTEACCSFSCSNCPIFSARRNIVSTLLGSPFI